ncbi:MAG: hypothetical protein IJ336_02325 [Lachnospiraceae bacterium]|nr:hypothetical protein [Lachnospiraceae bacterium]
MANFFLALVDLSITASYFIVAVVLLRFVLAKAPKWIRGILWGLVGIRLTIPFSVESMFSLIPDKSPIPALYESGVNSVDTTDIPEFNVGVGATPQAVETLNTGVVPETMQAGSVSVATILGIVWLVGLAAMLVYCTVTYIRLNKSVADAVLYRGGKHAIYQSEKVASPFVLGIFAPRIFIPYHMGEEDLQCVIAHEKAHIARKDHWIKPLGYVILSVHWFNPLVWLAYVLLCRDIELACDESVIRQLGMEHKKIYSEALLKCSVSQHRIAACPLAFGEVGVKKRITNVLHYKKPAFWVIVVALVLCAVVAVCFMTKPKDDDLATDKSEQELVEQELRLEQEMAEQEMAEQEMTEQELLNEQERLEQELIEQMVAKGFTEPPTMRLSDALSSAMNFTYVQSGTYSWTHADRESGDAISTEASGPFVTIAVKGKEEDWIEVRDYNGFDYAPYHASFDIKPDYMYVREYDLLELGNMEPNVLSEMKLEDVYFLELRPRRIYEVKAVWEEENLETNGFYGEANYIFATDNYAVAAENTTVIIEAVIKETMVDTEDMICITSKTEEYPGAFVVRIPKEVYDKDTLVGGQRIMLSMKDTGEMYDAHLPLYEADGIRIYPMDENMPGA